MEGLRGAMYSSPTRQDFWAPLRSKISTANHDRYRLVFCSSWVYWVRPSHYSDGNEMAIYQGPCFLPEDPSCNALQLPASCKAP